MTVSYDKIIQKGIQARQANRRQEALRLFKEAIGLAPNQSRAYREAGVECRDMGLFDESNSFFDVALMHAPNDLATKVHQAVGNRVQGKHELCLQQLTEVAEKDAVNAWVCNELGITLKELGRLTEAGQKFRQALSLAPTNVSILWQFALFARVLGNRKLALTQFETINKYHPLNVAAYREAATELQALGRLYEASEKLRLAFIQSQNLSLLEKYLLFLFEHDIGAAVKELFFYAASYPIPIVLIQRFFDCRITQLQHTEDLVNLPIHQIASFLGQENFNLPLITFRFRNFGAFIDLLSYLEPRIISLTEVEHQPLINGKLFLFLIIFALYKKNSLVTHFIIDHIEFYLPQFTFSELCKARASLEKLTNRQFVMSSIAKAAIEHYSVDCLLASLIMRGYFPEEPCFSALNDKEVLLKLLPSFCISKNEAILKNIFTHLLQKEILSLTEIKTLYPDQDFFESIKAIDNVLKPIFQVNVLSFRKPLKLKVALCISGQLRGYKEAYNSIKKSIVDPLQPDIFVHTWQDVGFKKPYPIPHANRVFQGHFLRAYQDLMASKNYSYDDAKGKLPNVFSLLDNNCTVTEKQLKEFYQTDFVVVEDDQSGDFEQYTNQQKMRYKIAACNQLMQTNGKFYDLVIRLRPDLELHAVKDTNWLEVAEACNNGKVIMVDWCTGIKEGIDSFIETCGGIYGIGDQIAIGSQRSMDFYAGMLKLKETFVGHRLAFFNMELSHILFGHGLWLGGYVNRSLPLTKGQLINTVLKAEDIFQAIQHDLINLDRDVAERLVKALENDIRDQQ